MAIKISGNTVIDDSQNISVSGNATANSFVGDGSNLTNLPGGGNVTEATASGTLADGSTVVVNADGTVSVAAQTGSASPSAGSPVTFEASRIEANAATYDSTNNRVVIVYKDYFNSFYGTAVVGTVSGTSISFGTPVVYQYANFSFPAIAYDSTNDRVVITYMDSGNSNYATAIVGDVDPSNNSITFGTKIAYNSARSDYTRATFDSTNGKVVFTYMDTGNNSYGTARVGEINPSNNSITFGSEVVFNSADSAYIGATFDSTSGKVVIGFASRYSPHRGRAVVGEVSGTSISFGTPVIFDSTSRTEYAEPAYDSSTDRIVIAYRDGNNTERGTAVVGEVSGTSISFGTPQVFDSNTIYTPSTVYDSVNQKVVIGYSDSGNSSSGTAIIATVYPSNNNITFGSPTTFTPGGATYISGAYDSANKRIVFAYMDDPWGSTFHGKAVVYAVNTISTNLTSENYIGISNGAYSDGQTATIQLIGSVDDAQSSLTPGQKYYVQDNGTLAESGSVFAGTAVSSTSLVVKS